MPQVDLAALWGGGQTASAPLPAAEPAAVSFPQLEGGQPPAQPAVKPPPPTTQVRRVGGIEDLGWISRGVQSVESSFNEKASGDHNSSTGPSFGLMGIKQAVADDHGVKGDEWKTDGAANQALGDKHLSHLYNKYGNWDDALGAYNQGQGTFDKWVAAGRPDDDTAKAVHKYIKLIMDGAGLDSPGRRFIQNRGKLTQADLSDMWKGVETPSGASRPPQDNVPSPFEPFAEHTDEEGANEVRAFTYGAMRAIADVPLGLAQTVLEQVSPATAKKLTESVNDFDERHSDLTDAHPYLNFGGKVFGTTIGLMGLGKLATAGVEAIPQAASMAAKIPALAKGAVGAAAFAGTGFTQSGDPTDRLWMAPTGALFGTLGVGLAKGAAWTMRNIVAAADQSAFIQQLKNAVQHLGPNLSEVKDRVLETLRAGDAEIRASVDKAQLLATQIGAQVRQAVEEEKGSPAIAKIGKQVNEIMGVTREEARKRAADVEYERFQKNMDKWKKDIAKKAGSHAGPTLIRHHVDKAIREGKGPPTAPAPYKELPITSSDYSKGMQYLNTMHRSVRDAATKGAVARMRSGVEGYAGPAVRDTGGKFVSAAKLRGAFPEVKKTFDDLLGSAWQTARGAAEIPPAKFYDTVNAIVKRGYFEEIEGLKRYVGSSVKAQQALTNTVLHKMLMDAGPNLGKEKIDPEVIHQFIVKHGPALRHLLSHEEYAKLEGFSKVSQRLLDLGLAGRAVSHAGGRIFGWSGFLGIMGLEHAIRGDVQKGAMLVASGVIAHSIYHFGSTVMQKMPHVNSILRRAAKTRPDSAEMDNLTSQLMQQYWARYGAYGKIVGQTVAETMNQ
jgi:hypothetical protein